MNVTEKESRLIEKVTGQFESYADGNLVSLVLYGAAVREEHVDGRPDTYLLVVLKSLELSVLAKLTKPVAAWRTGGQSIPRYFSKELLVEAADVFPLELLDIRNCHKLLSGSDVLSNAVIRDEDLRHQCERELRENMMRVREAFVETGSDERALRRLLVESVPEFAQIFRGCLHLAGKDVPRSNLETMTAFGSWAVLDSLALEASCRLWMGQEDKASVPELFERYYDTLTKCVKVIDSWKPASTAPNL